MTFSDSWYEQNCGKSVIAFHRVIGAAAPRHKHQSDVAFTVVARWHTKLSKRHIHPERWRRRLKRACDKISLWSCAHFTVSCPQVVMAAIAIEVRRMHSGVKHRA